MTPPLKGLIAATFTPMDTAGELNLDAVPGMVDVLLERRVAGLYVNGTTGEGPSLTGDERRRTAEAFVRAAARRVPVLVQVGHNSLGEAKALAAHAREIGAFGISATPPGYFKSDSADGLSAVMGEIAGAAPELPFYYYHIPAFGGVAIDMADFIEIAGSRIPNFRGVKFSSPTLAEFDRCRRASGGRFDILFGVDEMLLGALAMGAEGAVGSTYNFAAPHYLEMMDAFRQGRLEDARRLQSQAVDMVAAILEACGRAGLKHAMAISGVDCGVHRLPIEDPSRAQREALAARLAKLGILESAAS